MKKRNVFTRVPSYENFSFVKTLIKGRCIVSGINPESVVSVRKRFVLLHFYLETGIISIVAFSDSMKDLVEIELSHPRYGSKRHSFHVVDNDNLAGALNLSDIKDSCLINICKNVAEYLAVGEYAMFKKSYCKSQAWFDKAKNSCSLGAEILDNY